MYFSVKEMDLCFHLGLFFKQVTWSSCPANLGTPLITQRGKGVFIISENSVSAEYLGSWGGILILKDGKSLVGPSKFSVTVGMCIVRK